MLGKTFIATTGRGIARASLSADDQWDVEFQLTDCDIHCLAAEPLNGTIVYVGTHESEVLRSTDMGKTWQSSGLTGLCIQSLAVSNSEPRKVYAGTKPPMLFIARILSVVETCRLQHRSCLDFIRQALLAFRSGLPPPSLLPLPASTIHMVPFH